MKTFLVIILAFGVMVVMPVWVISENSSYKKLELRRVAIYNGLPNPRYFMFPIDVVDVFTNEDLKGYMKETFVYYEDYSLEVHGKLFLLTLTKSNKPVKCKNGKLVFN